jgi:uncharacterized protein (DUF305 family)
MEQKVVLYGIIGLLAGSLITIMVASNAVNNNNGDMMRMMGMQQHVDNMVKSHEEDHQEEARNMERMSSMEGMMHNMNMSLKGKTGTSFDKAFIEEMIIHHQGAIDMAKQAQINAQHEEIKVLANDIITAQTKEIELMKEWQKAWGY